MLHPGWVHWNGFSAATQFSKINIIFFFRQKLIITIVYTLVLDVVTRQFALGVKCPLARVIVAHPLFLVLAGLVISHVASQHVQVPVGLSALDVRTAMLLAIATVGLLRVPVALHLRVEPLVARFTGIRARLSLVIRLVLAQISLLGEALVTLQTHVLLFSCNK